MPDKRTQNEIKVGIFVTTGLALIMAALLILGGTTSFITKKVHFNAFFPNSEGLIPGAKVVLSGIHVGTVDKIDFEAEKGRVQVKLVVAAKYAEWIRKDCSAEIVTQGVLGDKYITLYGGNLTQPILESGNTIPNKPSKDLSQFISQGDHLLVSLNRIAGSIENLLQKLDEGNRSETIFQGLANTSRNLSSASDKLNQELNELNLKRISKNLNAILEKINQGSGTLGALVNDPGLYDDAKSLLGGANRNRILRNLVRSTVKEGDEASLKSESPTAQRPAGDSSSLKSKKNSN
jgi:phospholipid/cholesterol/gamma-HCH transport system substrate-binding protein